jgi:hypothetical protein
MADVGREQTSDSKQSQIEASDMLVVSGLSVRSQNKTILEDVSFKAIFHAASALHQGMIIWSPLTNLNLRIL